MIQIDIPMPKTCYECPCHDGEYGRCQITGNSYYDEIPRSCPCREIPSTRQERKKGKWIVIAEFEDCRYAKCNQCKVTQIFYYNKPLTNFCPNCGSDNRGEQDG